MQLAQQNINGAKPKISGKKFTMIGAKATTSDNLIRGKCFICDRVIDVFYDSGASDCVKNLDFLIIFMPYDIVVSSLTNESITTSFACLGCFVIIHGRTFSIDMICFTFSCLDVVLGIDWFSSNHVLL